MLVNFRFSNCRSFYDETVLSMQAAADTTKREINTFFADESALPNGDNELIKSAVVFGGNASGKSNLIKAFSYMASVVRFSAAHLPIVAGNEAFAFRAGAVEVPSLYEVEIIQDSIYYKYGFEILGGRIIHEWLSKREKHLTPVFERKDAELTVKGLSQKEISLIKIPDATLFLSVGNNFNLPINQHLNAVLKWFSNTLIVFENNANALDIYTMENGKYKEKALEILKRADIGIADFKVIKDKVESISVTPDIQQLQLQLPTTPGQFKTENNSLYRIDMQTDFPVFDQEDKVTDNKHVMLFKDNGFNSEGTIRLFCYLGWILAALDLGMTIFLDEIDSKLHFLVADYIIGLFNSIENNPKNAQLICTAHNVMLMDEGLRRDQIYFTSKDKQGRSSLVSLADFNGVRKNDLFSKRYLAGFYASIPDMQTKD